MLSTGVFDNLAHIVKEFYKLAVRNIQVSLKLPKSKNKSIFFDEIQRVNNKLYAFLSSENLQTEINTFYPIRDSLQHREIFRGVLYSGPSIYRKNLIQLSDEVFDSMKETINTFSSKFFHDHFLNSYLFIIWAQKVLINLVDGVLSSIDWDSIIQTLPVEIQDKIRESNTKFEQGVGTFLRWTEVPWYF